MCFNFLPGMTTTLSPLGVSGLHVCGPGFCPSVPPLRADHPGDSRQLSPELTCPRSVKAAQVIFIKETLSLPNSRTMRGIKYLHLKVFANING
jgi:hypothetical protein